ncbi:hypothetical protein INR49_001965 [Caranx melampygus]|nr:hypothetical protein INR49_001965 [Caranx melampygus]
MKQSHGAGTDADASVLMWMRGKQEGKGPQQLLAVVHISALLTSSSQTWHTAQQKSSSAAERERALVEREMQCVKALTKCPGCLHQSTSDHLRNVEVSSVWTLPTSRTGAVQPTAAAVGYFRSAEGDRHQPAETVAEVQTQ